MGADFTYYGSYVGAGYLISTLNSSGKADNYVRWLDLDKAIAITQWDEETLGSFTRFVASCWTGFSRSAAHPLHSQNILLL